MEVASGRPLDVDLIKAAVAALPFLVILGLMLFARWSAAGAGGVGLVAAVTAALLVFGYGAGDGQELGRVRAVGGALLEGALIAGTILWIIVPALCLYQLQIRTGAMEVLRRSIARMSEDPRVIAILVAWFFALFIEGAAGFGAPVALAAPFLVSAGFQPVRAVAMVLIGHSVGVSFGAVGTPVIPQLEATGLRGPELAAPAGLYHTLLGWIMLLLVVRLASRQQEGAAPAQGGIWGWTALAAVSFLIPFFLIARFVGPELPSLGGALIGGMLFVGLLRLGSRTRPAGPVEDQEADAPAKMGIIRAASPYLMLVALILVTRLVPPVQSLLYGPVLEWRLWGRFSVDFRPLYQPGTLLMACLVLGAALQRAGLADVRGAVSTVLRGLVPVVLALLAMLGLSRTMVHAEMIESLAVSAAELSGRAWPLLAPFVGVLGTFVTGSATASNVLFTDLQLTTATRLDLPAVQLLGVQNFGAAVGNIICPHNIVAAGATVGLSGREGEVLRKTLLACLLYAALGGVVVCVTSGFVSRAG